MDDIIIVGAGIGGLTLGLALQQAGIPCRIFESAPEIKAIGVGINLLPHATKELAALGLEDALARVAIETTDATFFNRFGQLIYQEPLGRAAGYDHPQFSIHRGDLQMVLRDAFCARAGAERLVTGRHCLAVEQDETGVTVNFVDGPSGVSRFATRGRAAIACDGINSVIRKQFYPDDDVAFAGINSWRGVTRRNPILTGRSYIRVGSILTGKIVIYPIIDRVDSEGNQLINWMAEIKQDSFDKNDWNKPGNLADFFPIYENWRFDWLDVAGLIEKADSILEYPMVDKDPLERWTFGRVTLAGDAAHPMYPRGSNGAAQGAIDARTLADCLAVADDPCAGLKAYEGKRLSATADVVRTNRQHPPDFINIRVEELVGDRPFTNLDDYISQDELRALSERYKQVAGFAFNLE